MTVTEPAAGYAPAMPTIDLPTVDYGRGAYVYDSSGKQYIDGSGGPAVFCLGHGNAEVNAAIVAQIDRIAHGYRYTFASDALDGLQAIIADKIDGKEITAVPDQEPQAQIIDLMEALKNSLANADDEGGGTGTRKAAKRAAPAAKGGAKKRAAAGGSKAKAGGRKRSAKR